MTTETPPSKSKFYGNGLKVRDEDAKKEITRAIKPDKSLVSLPQLQTKPKRILLITPPGTLEESYGRLSGAAGELPMLGLAYIAASLRDQGNTVKIIDYEVNNWPMDRVHQDIESFDPDIVGMTAYITNMKRCSTVAKIAKMVNSKISVVLGGPQVSIFPEEAFYSPDVDLIVLSEGEIVIRNVINALGDEKALRQVKGIWFKTSSGDIIRNEKEGLADNIDIFPPPALDLFEMKKYFPPVHIRGKKVTHMLTTRGCPFKCTFCETKLTFGRSFRYHSRERVISEMEGLINSGFKSFQFYDDIFTANKEIVEDLCNRILEKGWEIEWTCFTRADCLDRNLLKLMKKAGCYLISFGTESGDDLLLENISKDLTVYDNFEGVRLTKEEGIQVTTSFMLGLPNESREQTLKTIQFSIDCGSDYAVFPITEPYPGTELWVDANKYGYFDNSGKHQNNLLSENSAVWVPHGRTRKELELLSYKANLKFYLRPRIIMNFIKNIYYLPIGRVLRFYWASLVYLCSKFKTVKSGARY
jgi:anaerobic magnesium-protoporphyrin IX monomethyl ester cyclase